MNILIVSATNKEFSRTALHFHNNKNEISGVDLFSAGDYLGDETTEDLIFDFSLA